MDRGFVDAWLSVLGRWVAMHPIAASEGLNRLANEISGHLAATGFTVDRHPHRAGDLIVATHRGVGPVLGIYDHYDVEPGGRTQLRITATRAFGRGVADNLGPLALRLLVMSRLAHATGNIVWLIEPSEELGSPALEAWLSSTPRPKIDLWLDETGYFDADGTQRILIAAPDAPTLELTRRCGALANDKGRPSRTEHRYLRRVVPDAAFHVEALFEGSPYLAIGPNDDHSDVHGEEESLPLDTIELSAQQFAMLLCRFSEGAPR